MWHCSALFSGEVWLVRESQRQRGRCPSTVEVSEEGAGWNPHGLHQVELHEIHRQQGGQSGGATWTKRRSQQARGSSWEILLRLLPVPFNLSLICVLYSSLCATVAIIIYIIEQKISLHAYCISVIEQTSTIFNCKWQFQSISVGLKLIFFSLIKNGKVNFALFSWIFI